MLVKCGIGSFFFLVTILSCQKTKSDNPSKPPTLLVGSFGECIFDDQSGILECASDNAEWKVSATDAASDADRICWRDSRRQLQCRTAVTAELEQYGQVHDYFVLENTVCFRSKEDVSFNCNPESTFSQFIVNTYLRYQPYRFIAHEDIFGGNSNAACSILVDRSIVCDRENEPPFSLSGKFSKVSYSAIEDRVCGLRDDHAVICRHLSKPEELVELVEADVMDYVQYVGILCLVTRNHDFRCDFSLGRKHQPIANKQDVISLASDGYRICTLSTPGNIVECTYFQSDIDRELQRKRGQAHADSHSQGLDPEDLEMLQPIIDAELKRRARDKVNDLVDRK